MTRTASAAGPLAAQAAADEIAHQLAEPEGVGAGLPHWWSQSLAHGAAGIALLHIERAASGRASWDRARAWLRFATSRALSVGPNAALFYGAPAIEFALQAGAPHLPGVARSLPAVELATDQVVRRRLDTAERRLRGGGRSLLAEFDCIRGLAGLGALLLGRADPSATPLGEVLAYLVALTEPLQHGDQLLPGWWTDLAPNSKPSPEKFPDGHANNGMAHGVAGVLAVLALALRQGSTVDGQSDAIERILAWLDQWRQLDGSRTWWPYWITRDELRAARTTEGGPRRPSWCYGTLGLARAQQLAAIALNDPARRAMAEDAAAAALVDREQLGRIEDASLCHGFAGLIHIATLLADDSPAPSVIADHIPALLGALTTSVARTPSTDSGWLEGRAGTALALHALARRPATGWDRALLIA